MNKIAYTTLLLLTPELALAAGDPNQAIQSIIDIFGLDPRSLQTILDGTNAPGILAAISSVINAAALGAAVALMIWTTITMTANTAHEGEPGGKKYSNLWIPLRSAFSLALVMPIAKGYSLVQIMILLFAALGFKFADLTYDAVLDYFKNTGPIVNVSPPNTEEMAIALYNSHICMLKLSDIKYKGKKEQKITINKQRTTGKDGTQTYSYSFDGRPGFSIAERGCGSFTISHPPGPVSAYMHKATIAAFTRLTLDLNKEAARYLLSKKKSSREVKQKTADSMQTFINAYNASIRTAAAKAIQQGEGEVNQANKAFYTEAKDAGWLYAGTWFWTMAGINRQISDAIATRPAYTHPDFRRMGSKYWAIEVKNELIRINATVIPKMESAGVAGLTPTLTVGDAHDTFARLTHVWFSPLMDKISAFFLDDGHAEVKLQSLGHWIIGSTEALWITAALIKGKVDAAAGASEKGLLSFIPGIGNAISATAKGAQSIIHTTIKILGIFSIAFFMLGLLLAFYFPAIPFINWFAAVIGWLVMLLEAIFAAPFWAAAHAVPEGDGIAGSHGKAGWMLVLSLIARPVLMIAGLVGGMLLLHYGSELLLVMFAPFVKGMTAGNINGLVTLLGMLALLVIMVLILAKTAFSLVYVIPDRTLAWIGQSSANLGETQTSEEGKTMMMAAGRGGDKVVKETTDKIAGKGKENGQGQGEQGAKEQGATSDADNTQATNDAAEEQHAPGNVVAKGEGQGEKATAQEHQQAAGDDRTPNPRGHDRDA